MRRIFPAALVAALAWVLVSCAAQAPTPDAPQSAEVVVKKSPNDSRDYKYLVLPNKLRVLLVSDPATDKSAAALAVYRGSQHEPADRPGLAHFLEHMLFIGTEKYPEVDTFQQFITGNGGSSNAYTASDHTNYFFDIQPAAFREGLDRFAHFFIDPLLSPEYVDREKNAVHSEYQMQIKQDNWRQSMVGKLAMNQDYPGSRFNIGSLETLDGDVKADLETFKAEHYSADQMGLVALSEQSIAEMEDWIVPLFSAVPNNDLGPKHTTLQAFTGENLPATLYSQSLKDLSIVEYTFPVPATHPVYKKKPEQYISNLLGHEGTGSLHKLLTDKGWIESLAAGGGALDRNNSLLTVRIELTQNGAEQIPAITDLLFQYIGLLQSTPPQKWLYDEQATVAELAFRYQEKGSPQGFVYQMAPRLDEYPPEDLLIAPTLMEGFDGALIEKYLGSLTKDNVLVEIIAPSVETDSVETWFEVPYKLVKGPIAIEEHPTNALHLPAQNPYLPDDLELLAKDQTPVTSAIDQPGLQLWLDTDTEFGTPRANLFLDLAIEGGFVTARDRAMAQLYRAVVQDSLSESVYPAYLAGLGYSLGVPNEGYAVRINGFHDKQLVLLEDVLAALLGTEIKPDRFETLKAGLMKDWQNFSKEYPYAQSLNAVTDTLLSARWPMVRLAEAAQSVTYEDLEKWRSDKLASVSVTGLLHGNLETIDVDALASLLQRKLPIEDLSPVEPELVAVAEPLLLEIPVDHNDASMVIYVQDDDDSIEARATSSLAGQVLRSPYFSSLRTDQQLGYVVSAGNRRIEKRNSLIFIVQSPAKGADHLEQATIGFLDAFVADWDGMSNAEFEQHKAGLINRLLQTDKNLGQRSQRLWGDIVDENFSFDTREQIARAVGELTKDDLGAYLKDVQRKLREERLLVFSRGQFDGVPTHGTQLDGPTALKG
jgi:secreted Zn-dependent insulinase-like peptidase